MIDLRLIPLTLAAQLAAGSVFAQDRTTEDEPSQRPLAPIVAAPYETELLRLSEVLGAIHYLRALCKPDEPAPWRKRMAAIIAAEQPTPEFEARLTNRFNRGYETFSLTYRSCSASATLALDRYLTEGATLSNGINERYGS